jgi:amidase
MKRFKEYDRFDGLGMARLVQQKEVSALELCEEAIARIEKLNPKINAVIHLMFDQARKRAAEKLPRGPFAGVPFLLKDLVNAHEGEPFTQGCRGYKEYRPDHHSELVKRFLASGLIVLGKTNTPEFGLLGVTEPELHGPTRNPWNINHSPGGSSGGSARDGRWFLASGGTAAGRSAYPQDGVVFSPQAIARQTPSGPDSGQGLQGAAVEHVISRSVRDSAAMLDCIRGADPGAPYEIAEPETPYLKEVKKDPGRLRIGFCTSSPIGTRVDNECVRAVEEAAALLASLGHRVEEKETEVDGRALAMSYFVMYYGEVAADVASLSSYLGRPVKKGDVEQLTLLLSRLGAIYNSGEFVQATRQWNTAARAMARYFDDYDLYMTPTAAVPPLKIGEKKTPFAQRMGIDLVMALGMEKRLVSSGMIEKIAFDGLAPTPFTQLANLTGLPAMSVPLYWNTEGLPCGIQFIAPFGGEDRLFRLAGQLEKSRPWFDRVPPHHATSTL